MDRWHGPKKWKVEFGLSWWLDDFDDYGKWQASGRRRPRWPLGSTSSIRFLLVFHTNHKLRMHCFAVGVWDRQIDGRTDRWTDRSIAYCSRPALRLRWRRHNNRDRFSPGVIMALKVFGHHHGTPCLMAVAVTSWSRCQYIRECHF